MSIELVTAICQALADNANPEKAAGMRAYMKSAMPYRGVQTPIRRKLVRAALRAHPLASRDDWLAAVRELWRGAAYREERYAAQDVIGAPEFRAFRTLDALPLYEEMVVSGAWWDFVDDVATRKLRELVDRYPEKGRPHAGVEPRRRPVETPLVHHLPGEAQGDDRPGAAL